MKIQINGQAPRKVIHEQTETSKKNLIHYLENIENIEGCFIYWIKDKDGKQRSNLFTTKNISLDGILRSLHYFMNHLKDMKENMLRRIKELDERL